MSKYSQGTFTPTNPSKYIGSYPIVYRSSWELSVFRVLDAHASVLQWASESIAIPYINPLTNKGARYYPDLMIVYQNGKGEKKVDVIEIKPACETFLEKAKSKKAKLAYAVNQAKWEAAIKWCHERGMNFLVKTELDLFKKPKRKK